MFKELLIDFCNGLVIKYLVKLKLKLITEIIEALRYR